METTTLEGLPYNKHYFSQNNNGSQNDFVRWQIFHKYFVYFVCTEIVIIIPTIFGNALILTSIAKFRRLRTDMHILVANLAVSDLLVGIVLIPTDIVFLCIRDQMDGMDTKYLCLIVFSTNIAFLFSSVLNLTLISIERYIAIVYPLTYSQKCSGYRLRRAIAGSWLVVFTIGVMPIAGWNTWQSSLPCDAEFVLPLAFRVMLQSFLMIALVLNSVLYIKVVRTAWKQMDSVEKELRHYTDKFGPKHRTMKRDFRKAKVMMLILGVFIICWGPYCICSIVNTFISNDKVTVIVSKVLFQLGILNSGLNWIIFGLKNKDYRHAFKQILKCNREEKSSSFTMTSSSDNPGNGGQNIVHPKIPNKDNTLKGTKSCVTSTFQNTTSETSKARSLRMSMSPAQLKTPNTNKTSNIGKSKSPAQPKTPSTNKARNRGIITSPAQPKIPNTNKTGNIGLYRYPNTTTKPKAISGNKTRSWGLTEVRQGSNNGPVKEVKAAVWKQIP